MTAPASAPSSSGAIFSEDRRWRYALWRYWDQDVAPLMVIGLNPSTADEVSDDPTVRRCLGYARDWGFGGLRMLNAFAWRATDPQRMFERFNQMAPSVLAAANAQNDEYILAAAVRTIQEGGPVLAAWGNHARWHGRNLELRNLLDGLGIACFGLTGAFEPKHPLYLRKDIRPVPFIGDGGRLCCGSSNGCSIEGQKSEQES